MTKLEQQILTVLTQGKKPQNRAALAKQTGVTKNQKQELTKALDQLIGSQQIVYSGGRYGLPRQHNLVPGTIVKVTGTFGFAKPTEEGAPDLFVPGRFLLGSMPGDQVLLKPGVGRGGELSEGVVLQITEEKNQPFVGILTRDNRGDWQVEPDRYVRFPIRLDPKVPVVGKVGEKVLAVITHRGERHNDHRAQALQVFGDAESAAVCAEAILAEQGVERLFPPEVTQQAEALSTQGIHPKEAANRVDLRDATIFTIDGADTKDIDDAISLVKTKSGWELGVHIADVSYYVTRQSPLDQEAFSRGTSVYFADQVVPMLPTQLSNGICSLNPSEDRLAFSAHVQLDSQGQILGYRFEKSLICSQIKGVYSEINALLGEANPPKEIAKKYAKERETLGWMAELAAVLHKNRSSRNAMDLSSPESKIVIGEDGRAVDIIPRQTGQSENMIEEFMLVANQAAASFAKEHQLPFVYRVHESPAADRLEALFGLLESLGIPYNRPKENQSPAVCLTAVLASVKDTPLGGIVNYAVLRTMAKAVYSADNKGHFGLALGNYAHFTSPIRRYPDLAIHRILTSYLTGMKPENIEKQYRGWVEICSSQSTDREIAAMTAERSAEDCYKAEYMQQFVGQQFEGVISSTTSFGIFIQLETTVEGLIHTDYFPAGRWFYDGLITFQNEVGGAKLRLGDSIKVNVASVSIPSGQVNFTFAEPQLYTTENKGNSAQLTLAPPPTKKVRPTPKSDSKPQAGKHPKGGRPKPSARKPKSTKEARIANTPKKGEGGNKPATSKARQARRGAKGRKPTLPDA